MRKTILAITFGLLIGLSSLPILGIAAHRHDGNGSPFNRHFQELSFTIAPGASQSFPIPEGQDPVRIDISFSVLNGGTQTPSEIMYAVVNQDPTSSKFTWVGTNNDGSTQVGTSTPSGSNPLIARICGGGCPTTNATLEVDSDSTLPGTLKLTVNAATGILPGHFKVNMWF